MGAAEHDRVVPVIDRLDVDPGLRLHAPALVAEPFAERPLWREVAGMDETLDHDLGIRREGETGVFSLDALQCVPAIGAHHVELAHAGGGFCGGCQERERVAADDDADRHLFAARHVFVAVDAPVLAGRDVEPDALAVVDHHAVGAAVDPAGVGVAGDDEAAGADVAPAVVRVPQGRRELRHVDRVALDRVLEHRPVGDDLMRDRLQVLGVRVIAARQLGLGEMLRETQRQVFARAGEPVDQQAEAGRTAFDVVEQHRRRALVVAHHLDHLAHVGMPVGTLHDLQIAHGLHRGEPVAQVVVLQGASVVGRRPERSVRCRHVPSPSRIVAEP